MPKPPVFYSKESRANKFFAISGNFKLLDFPEVDLLYGVYQLEIHYILTLSRLPCFDLTFYGVAQHSEDGDLMILKLVRAWIENQEDKTHNSSTYHAREQS